MNEQQDYEQRFNDHCAKIVGLKTGSGCTDQIYFRDDGMHGTYECKIENYVPYTSLDQLEEVVEVLKSTLRFTVDLEEQNRQCVLATYRSMVDNIGDDCENCDDCDDCDNHPDETVDDRVEDIKRKLVNAHCAKTMGWTRSVSSDDEEMYFDGITTRFVCNVEDYNPYDDVNKMVVVIDAMASGLNLRPKSCTITSKGHREARRELILDNIVSEEDKKAELLGIDKLVHQPYEVCAERMEELEEFVTDLCVAEENDLDVEEAEDEYDKNHSKPHPMYDDNLQAALEENTKRQFEHSLQLNMPYNDDTSNKEVIKGCVGRERFWEDEENDEENDEGIITDDFISIGNPRSIYWQSARILLLAKYRGNDDMYIDNEGCYRIGEHGNPCRCELVRFNEQVEIGLLQAYQIEAYIRNPDNCMEVMWAKVSAETPYFLPELVNLEDLHQHRLKIIKGVLTNRVTEYITKEEVFNELCQRITKTVMKHCYVIDTSTFNPYQDIQQLTRIVEMVLAVTGEPFVVNGQGGVNMMKEMQEYIEVYSTEKYMTLEDL